MSEELLAPVNQQVIFSVASLRTDREDSLFDALYWAGRDQASSGLDDWKTLRKIHACGRLRKESKAVSMWCSSARWRGF